MIGGEKHVLVLMVSCFFPRRIYCMLLTYFSPRANMNIQKLLCHMKLLNIVHLQSRSRVYIFYTASFTDCGNHKYLLGIMCISTGTALCALMLQYSGHNLGDFFHYPVERTYAFLTIRVTNI